MQMLSMFGHYNADVEGEDAGEASADVLEHL